MQIVTGAFLLWNFAIWEPGEARNTPEMRAPVNVWRCVRSGAFAGAVSTFGFTLIHDLWISDIWSMLVIMSPSCSR